jgi:hypothetical protein
MVYCDTCREKNKWPEGWSKSRRRCEICGQSAPCNDVPSSELPLPPKPANAPVFLGRNQMVLDEEGRVLNLATVDWDDPVETERVLRVLKEATLQFITKGY